MAALRAAGISFDVVPGITAAFAAAAETEIPLTLRDVVVGAGLCHRPGRRRRDAAGLGRAGAVAARPSRSIWASTVAGKVAARLVEAGLAPSTPVAVIENASRADRRAYAGRLDELAALAARPELAGPVLIIVGDVVAAGRDRGATRRRSPNCAGLGRDGRQHVQSRQGRSAEGDHGQPAG